METIKIERTGQIYSFTSVQFIATMPNGDKVSIWSPPWQSKLVEENGEEFEMDVGYDDPIQDEGALKFAHELWENKNYIKLKDEDIALSHK
jgi:hypothetical protein